MTKDLGGTAPKEQVMQDVFGILGLESKFGDTAPTDADIEDSKKNRARLGKEANTSNISIGAAKIKLATLSFKEQKFLDINRGEDLKSMKNSVKAATYLYVKRHNYFDEYAKKNPHLKLTPDDVRLLTILSHNQGTGKLKSFGYNSEKTFNQAVSDLRALKEGKIKDVSSTNYKYGKALGAKIDEYNPLTYTSKTFSKLGKFAGDVAYGITHSEGHDPYIKRVLFHGSKLPEIKKLMKEEGLDFRTARQKVHKEWLKEQNKKDKEWKRKKWLEENEEEINKKFGFDQDIQA
jgi:hypothetical protein